MILKSILDLRLASTRAMVAKKCVLNTTSGLACLMKRIASLTAGATIVR